MSQLPRTFVRARQYPILSLFDEMNRLFDEGSTSAPSQSRTKFAPSLDITENEKEYVVHGDFPGFSGNDVQIEIRENTLTLSGERKQEKEFKEGDVTYVERSFGSFSRTIPFSVEIDEDNASAEMKNGVLTISIPKSPKVVKGVKKLTIKT